MKKSFIYMAFAVWFGCFSVSAQTFDITTAINSLKNQSWTNGFELVSYLSPADAYDRFDIKTTDGQPIVLAGGSLHEGGSILVVHYDDTSIWTDEKIDYQMLDEGDRLTFVPDAQVWLVRDKQAHTVKAILKSVENKMKGLELMTVNDMLRFGLAGIYKDSEGKSYTFSPSENKAEGFAVSDPTFHFARLYNSPHFILLFKDFAYSVSKTPRGLILVPVQCDADGFYQPISGAEALELRKISHPFRPDFPLVSEEYLTPSQISFYAGILNEVTDYLPYKERLKNQIEMYGRMRNEVFARHGYIFKSTKWQDYFGSKRWYKAEKTDVSAELSPIEKANVELIRHLEKAAQKVLNE